jgi:hypothetical protein
MMHAEFSVSGHKYILRRIMQGIQVLTALSVQIMVLWVAMPLVIAGGYHCPGRTCSNNFQSPFRGMFSQQILGSTDKCILGKTKIFPVGRFWNDFKDTVSTCFMDTVSTFRKILG